MKRNKRQTSFFAAALSSLRIPRWIWVFSVCVLLACVLIWGSIFFLKQLDFFRIKELIVRQGSQIKTDNSGDFSYLLGKNIFSVDLAAESLRIQRQYPSYKKIRLIKFLPDKIFVDFLRRIPVAAVRSTEPLFVDEAMVLFLCPQSSSGAGMEQVPEITGIERAVSRVRPGSVCRIPQLSVALQIIKQARLETGLQPFDIKRIDVAEIANTSIFLLEHSRSWDYTKVLRMKEQELLEVKIGREDIAQKMDLLETLLGQVKGNLGSIKYIDLRFKEPVIRFKERI